MRFTKHRKTALTLAVALTLCLGALAACAPTPVASTSNGGQTAAASDSEKAALSETGDTVMPGDFQSNEAGAFTATEFNKNFINDGNRGCGACHEDLWDVMSDLSPIQHVLSSPPGYGQGYQVNDCLACHHYNAPMGGPKLSDIVHTAHYSNAQFTDAQHGNCWSCHASNLSGELVLWDEYKYEAELGGYPDSSSEAMQAWLNLRQWSNNSMTDVVTDSQPAIDVTLSQKVSDEADMYVANNYSVPEFTPDTYSLTVEGAGENRTFTLADLQAMPQTERTATQDCIVNGINGIMVGNIPVKGVLLKDFIDACGGLPEGVTTMSFYGEDGWFHDIAIDFLLQQDAMIGLQYWGHDLTKDQGYPATLVIPGSSGAIWDKWVTRIAFGNVEGAMAGTWPYKDGFPDAFQGVMCSGWFSPGKDGIEVRAGEPVDISGYAYLNANMGHEMTQVAFSADYGQNWTTLDVPNDFDQAQWVYWEGTWTPKQAGTYVLHVKAVDNQGAEPYRPASMIVKVTE